MIEHVASRNAQVIGKWRRGVSKVAAMFIDEFDPNLRFGRTAAHAEFVATIRKAEPMDALGTTLKRAARDDQARGLTQITRRRRVAKLKHCALPAVATQI